MWAATAIPAPARAVTRHWGEAESGYRPTYGSGFRRSGDSPTPAPCFSPRSLHHATMPSASLSSPFGPLTVTEQGGVLTELSWRGGGTDRSALLQEAVTQLSDYFAGQRQRFDLPLATGTGFRARFLQALIDIPYGQTREYGALARSLGVPAQAIGQACGANCLPILIPCHRVLAANGLGGYSGSGGVETKVALLRHEGAGSLLL